jgi:hypothetical protein
MVGKKKSTYGIADSGQWDPNLQIIKKKSSMAGFSSPLPNPKP